MTSAGMLEEKSDGEEAVLVGEGRSKNGAGGKLVALSLATALFVGAGTLLLLHSHTDVSVQHVANVHDDFLFATETTETKETKEVDYTKLVGPAKHVWEMIEKHKEGGNTSTAEWAMRFGKLVADSADFCSSVAAHLESKKGEMVCTGLSVAAALTGAAGASEPSETQAVMSTVHKTYKLLADRIGEAEDKLQNSMETGFQKISDQISDLQIDKLEDQLSEVFSAYSQVVNYGTVIDGGDMNKYYNYLRLGEFKDYIKLVMDKVPKQDIPRKRQTGAAAGARFTQTRSQLLLLQMAQCAKAKPRCSHDTLESYANETKENIKVFKDMLEDMCLIDISGKTLGELPKGCFNNNQWHTDSEYESLEGDLDDLPQGITYLSVRNNKITGNLKSLRYRLHLTHLHVQHNSKISGYLESLELLSDLTHLHFDNSIIDGDLKSIGDMKHLTHLHLAGANAKTFWGDLASLEGMKDMAYLTIVSIGVSGYISSATPGFKLTHLIVYAPKVSGSLNLFAPKLKVLKVTGSGVLEADLEHLEGMHKLETLALSGIVKGDLKSLSEMTHLRKLTLYSTDVEGDLSSLQGMLSLRQLHLHGCKKISGNLGSLKEMTNLGKSWAKVDVPARLECTNFLGIGC